MPLPDERPRQSVANLIGRFEQQTKRQSVVPSSPSRTGSAQSNYTGDAAKEELKEKREWPPRPKTVIGTASTTIETSIVRDSDLLPKAAPAENATPVKDVPPVPPVPAPAPDPVPSSPETAVPVPKPTPARQSSVGSVTAPTRTPSTPSKSTPSRPSITTTRTPGRTPAKSPPTSFHAAPSASASTPARPSAAAKSSAASVSSPVRPRPSSRASHAPARAKTPVTRPKTPSSVTTPAHTTRPKTPASGLFAPTAASLAKARNASSPPPTPVRKPTTGPGVSERLSKPTAASLSKSVSPPPTRGGPGPRVGARGTTTRGITTTRGTASSRGTAPARGSTATRGTATRARGATSSTGAKARTTTTRHVTAAAISKPDPAPETPSEEQHEVVEHLEHAEEPEELASPVEHTVDTEHGHESSEGTLIDEPEAVSTDSTPEEGVHDAAAEVAEAILHMKQEDLDAEVTQLPAEVEETVTVDEDKAESNAGVTLEEDHAGSLAAAELHEDAPVETHEELIAQDEHEPEANLSQSEHEPDVEASHDEPHAEEAYANGATTPTPIGSGGTDLADLVNMLETKPSRPMSIASIPDEVLEIPDEY